VHLEPKGSVKVPAGLLRLSENRLHVATYLEYFLPNPSTEVNGKWDTDYSRVDPVVALRAGRACIYPISTISA
jgi:hypothetical protein